MSDDTDPHEEMEQAFDNLTQMVEGMFGPGPFASDIETEVPEGVRMAVLCMKSAHAIDEVADYLEDRDIDFEDPDKINGEDVETQSIVMGVSVMAKPLERWADAVTGDDDDDNPFKVSDGDDPIY